MERNPYVKEAAMRAIDAAPTAGYLAVAERPILAIVSDGDRPSDPDRPRPGEPGWYEAWQDLSSWDCVVPTYRVPGSASWPGCFAADEVREPPGVLEVDVVTPWEGIAPVGHRRQSQLAGAAGELQRVVGEPIEDIDVCGRLGSPVPQLGGPIPG